MITAACCVSTMLARGHHFRCSLEGSCLSASVLVFPSVYRTRVVKGEGPGKEGRHDSGLVQN